KIHESSDIDLKVFVKNFKMPYLKEAKAILTREEGVNPYLVLAKANIEIPLITGINVGEEVLKDGMVLTVDFDKGLVLEGETQVV
ncbi:MAG: PEP-utilizing enzyme, partial [bacterium]